jgi:hypothetical protein
VAAKKRVLLTVNPFLVTGKRMMTQRSLVTALDQHADLIIATAGDYDFAQGLVRAYRRIRGGKFEEIGMIAPYGRSLDRLQRWLLPRSSCPRLHEAQGFFSSAE